MNNSSTSRSAENTAFRIKDIKLNYIKTERENGFKFTYIEDKFLPSTLRLFGPTLFSMFDYM